MRGQDRRTFLKCAGAVALGAGLPGCAGGGGPLSRPQSRKEGDSGALLVRLDAPSSPLVDRSFEILKDRIQQRCPIEVAKSHAAPQVILALDDALAPEAFAISTHRTAVRVAGGSPRGLVYGVGKFLRTSHYAEAGFQPSPWRGVSAPKGSLRGMYFATHFHNWYHQASEPEIVRYLEDLALWGVNALMVCFPMINLRDWNDPDAQVALDMMRHYGKAAKGLGMRFATGVGNTAFINTPDQLRATRLPDPTHRRGNSGHPVCPSIAEGHDYILECYRPLYEGLAETGLDVLVFWPYDEGGCACAQCAPWGSNGYLKLSRDMTAAAKRIFPDLQTVLSTWMFDTPPEGEWQGLADYLKTEGDWLDYILADSHEEFPQYPLEKGVPGGRPLLNFPEISMWGNWPWGGAGANPLPGRFQRLWDQSKGVVRGGFPYSEGIYEDMNKAVVAQFYWNPGQSARTTLEEYIAYEFGPGVSQEVLALVDLLEENAGRAYQKQPVDPATAERSLALADAVHSQLPAWGRSNWRWEILRLRAILDRERFAGAGLESPEAEAAMMRLIEIYHCQMETEDPYHHRVRPPLRRARTLGKEI